MGIQDRDYMRHDRRAKATYRRSLSYGSLLWGVGSVIGFFYFVMLGHAWWTGQGREAMQRATQPAPTVALPAAANPDPFKDDPTWHTGPRPVIESPPPQSSVETRTVYKCSVNGKVTYSGPSDCRGGVATALPIDPGPDAARVAAAQIETQRSVAQANRQVEAVQQQRAAAEQARLADDAGFTRPQGVPRQAECAALEQAIQSLDIHARQPLAGPEQDRVRAERQRVRDRQHALHC